MEPDFLWMVSSGIATGALFGYVTQRGRFCMTRGLSNILIMGDLTVFRAYLLALAIAMIGTHTLWQMGLIALQVRPFYWLANMVGGMVFGVGMVLGGGCSSGSWYRAGEGFINSWGVILGFAIGATATSIGQLAPLRRMLEGYRLDIGTEPATMANALGVNPWFIIAIVAAAVLLWMAAGSTPAPQAGWSWRATGLALGIIVSLSWYTSSLAGNPSGITFTLPTSQVFTYPIIHYPNRLNWGIFMVIGVALGSFIGSTSAGEFHWRAPKGFAIIQQFTGGIIMGVGGMIAGGCNVSQGLTNLSTLGMGALLTMFFIILGAWATVYLLYLRK